MPLTYAIALLIAFYFLLIAEFFLPTGGLLGAAAAAALIAMIVIAFSHSLFAGLVLTATVIVTTPLILAGLVKAWPHTPIGRRMLNRRPGQLAEDAPPHRTHDGTPIDRLLGKIGTAKTNLLPGGIIVVDGQKLDAISAGMAIDAGDAVVIIKIEGNRVRVRPSQDEDLPDASSPPPQSPPALEESLDALDFE